MGTKLICLGCLWMAFLFKKKLKTIFYLLFIGFYLMVSADSCNMEDEEGLPIVTTSKVSAITDSTALCGGNVEFDGGSNVTVRGVILTRKDYPVEWRSFTTDSSGLGSYISNIMNLDPDTNYDVQAYATNRIGTAYGGKMSFTTLPRPLTLGTTEATSNSITLVGFVSTRLKSLNTVSFEYGLTTDYGEIVNAKVSPIVLIDPYQDIYQLEVGIQFEARIVGLSSNTKYHFRIKAIVSQGTIIGKDLTFVTLNDLSVNDVEGNLYNTVTIGTQIWMTENLKITKYNDGISIPLVSDSIAWGNLTTPAYCWYNNEEAKYKNLYGALYNWYTVNTGKLCPTGWHVPTKADWELLLSSVGNNQTAGYYLKDYYSCGTNSYGFSAKMGGMRYYFSEANFQWINRNGYWYSSSLDENSCPLYLWTDFYAEEAFLLPQATKLEGYSVRCIKD